MLRPFAACLKSHGISLPALAPGKDGKQLLTFVTELRSGSSHQRSAYAVCKSRM